MREGEAGGGLAATSARLGVLTGLAALAAGSAAVLIARRRPPRDLAPVAGKARPPAGTTSRPRPARGLDLASALLAGTALLDSAVEHYRGKFHNKFMFVPLVVAAQTLAASVHGAADAAEKPALTRDLGRGAAFATGIVGTGFHLYNIGKRPGGFGWLNLFYAAPLGAPAALSLAGMLGLLAERVRRGGDIAGIAPGPLVAALTAIGLLSTSAEAGLLHFRGAYHNPAMLIPVTVPPVAAALLLSATRSSPQAIAAARWPLRLLTAIGFAGTGFHAYGVSRNMGGWSNWSQNVLNGPPLPAPPSFTALAIAGLAALRLIEEKR